MKKKMDLPMEEIAAKVAAFGVPGLIFTCAVSATGLVGAAAITTALAALGPGGMIGGIAFLGVVGLITEGITQYGIEAILTSVVKQLYKNGETKESIKEKIDKYHVSKKLKLKLDSVLEEA